MLKDSRFTEIDEEFIEVGDEETYWEIESVSVEKEGKIITYYINLCVSTLVDLIFQEPGEYPYPAGKEAMDINGNLIIIKEEYATTSNIVNLEMTLNEMRHIEPDAWNTIKNVKERMTCKQFIKANDALEQYKKTFRNTIVHFDEKQIQKMRESLSHYSSLKKYKDEILNSGDAMKLQKLYFLSKMASGELNGEEMEPYKF